MFLLMCSFVALSNATHYKKGLHYTEIVPIYDTGYNKQLVVYEFFSYKCPHCANFQPYMKTLQNDTTYNVKFIRIPLGLNPSWRIFAQAYYAAEQLGILEKSHQAMFDAIHKKQSKFRSIESIANWYGSEFGIDTKLFLTTAQSFMVDSMINKSNNMAKKMLGVPKTPQLVINGKYKPDVNKLGSYEALIELSKQLIETEAREKGLSKSR